MSPTPKSEAEFLRAESARARGALARVARQVEQSLIDPVGEPLRSTVDKHPFVSVGVAAGVGCLLARFFGSRGRPARNGGGRGSGSTGPGLFRELFQSVVQPPLFDVARGVLAQILVQLTAPPATGKEPQPAESPPRSSTTGDS